MHIYNLARKVLPELTNTSSHSDRISSSTAVVWACTCICVCRVEGLGVILCLKAPFRPPPLYIYI